MRKKSLYRNCWSFRTISQLETLRAVGDDYERAAYNVDAECGVLMSNPLHMDNVFLAGIQLMSKAIADCYLSFMFVFSTGAEEISLVCVILKLA